MSLNRRGFFVLGAGATGAAAVKATMPKPTEPATTIRLGESDCPGNIKLHEIDRRKTYIMEYDVTRVDAGHLMRAMEECGDEPGVVYFVPTIPRRS